MQRLDTLGRYYGTCGIPPGFLHRKLSLPPASFPFPAICQWADFPLHTFNAHLTGQGLGIAARKRQRCGCFNMIPCGDCRTCRAGHGDNSPLPHERILANRKIGTPCW